MLRRNFKSVIKKIKSYLFKDHPLFWLLAAIEVSRLQFGLRGLDLVLEMGLGNFRLQEISDFIWFWVMILNEECNCDCIPNIFYLRATRLYSRFVGWLIGQLVSWLVGQSVPFLLFWHFWAFWAYGSRPDGLVTFSSTAPAHPHATRPRVAVYLALLC